MSAPAAGGAREQVARLLALVPYLHSRGELRVEDAARILDVPARQVVRDLKVLLMCGLPGGYPDDLIDVDLDALEGPDSDGVIRVSNADYLSRPLRLTPTEATALIVALRAVRSSADPATREVVDRTLRKLEVAAAEGAVHERIEVAGDDGDDALAATRSLLAQAVEQRRQVALTYWVPARDERTERVVDPVRVFASQGHDYLEAWCHRAEDRRLFRVDRVEQAEVLGTPADDHDLEPVELPEELFRNDDTLTRATLRLGPAARWVPDYYPVVEVRDLPDGDLEVDLLVADERWLRRLLLRLAPDATVVAPQALASVQQADASRVLDLYGGRPPSMETSIHAPED